MYSKFQGKKKTENFYLFQKNYQCFGNDTCSVSKKGQPVCQPEKGNEHGKTKFKKKEKISI